MAKELSDARKPPSLKVVKALFAVSGGVCAFPGCTTRLVHHGSGVMLGEMCHIHAASPGGPRYDPDQDTSARNDVDNLIILCPTHHSLIDQDSNTYTATTLRQMKVEHEMRVAAVMDDAGVVIDNQQAVNFARQIAMESVDFAIVVTHQRQLDALKHHFPELTQVSASHESSRSYYRGTVATALGGTYRVVATRLPRIGNIEAAHSTADLIRDWSPRFVVANGIAAGLSRLDQDFGDVVVSDSIVYYELGKVRAAGVECRNRQFLSDRTLVCGIQNLTGSEWKRRLPPRPDGKVPSDKLPRIHVGHIVSVDEWVATAEQVALLRVDNPKLIALEMESAGVASAAFSALKKVGFLTVRAIGDFADGQKNDNWQEYAAGAAASCLRAFLESRPVAPSEGRWPSRTAGVEPAPSEVSVGRRKRLFNHLCGALDLEEFKNFCFLLGVDALPGDCKSSQVRELILLFEHLGQLSVLESAVTEVDPRDGA